MGIYFTDKFYKLIEQMVKNGHKNIIIRLYPEDNYYSLESEWSLSNIIPPSKDGGF